MPSSRESNFSSGYSEDDFLTFETMEPKSSMSIGYALRELADQGVTDLGRAADALQQLKDLQNREGVFPYDRFTEHGSSAEAVILNEHEPSSRPCILWCVNHYLGLNRNPRVLEKTGKILAEFGTGSGTSAVSGGMSSLHKKIESRIGEMLGKEKVLLFPTGYTANLGALSSLPGKNDLILFDHECHASIIDGCRLSGRKWLAFRHNDLANLEAKLVEMRGKFENILVVVESAYSMSGDLSPIREIVELKKKHGFYLYVDEAHTFGFYGEGGRGYCFEQGVLEDVDFFMSTLSKATASLGGFIAAKRKFCTILQCSSNPYLFQACITPADAAAVLACLDEIQMDPAHASTLHGNAAYFRKGLTGAGFDLGTSRSPIIPIYVRDSTTLQAFGKDLYERGIFSVSVGFPAVKLNQGRVRFIVNASHTRDQIDRTLSVLTEAGRKYGLIPNPG